MGLPLPLVEADLALLGTSSLVDSKNVDSLSA
jgi:hypothetical protein